MSSSSTLCQEKIQPQILTLKLAPLNSDFTHQSLQNEGTTKRKQKMDGWSFIDSLTTTNPTQRPCIGEPYVHPLVKRSTDKLSANSLDMCTEVLGNETGSDLILSGDEFSSFLSQLENHRNKDNINAIARKKRSSRSSDIRRAFPPPLTSISSCKLRLKPLREGGRFVLRAQTIPSCKEIFHAERSHGRLRLRFNASNFSSKAAKEEEGKFEDEVVYEEEVDGRMNTCHQAEDKEVDDDENDNEDDADEVIDIEEKILWTQGCRERAQRSKGFCNWDSYWVATN